MSDEPHLPSPSTPPPSPPQSEVTSAARDVVAENLRRSDVADDAKAVGVATPAVSAATQAAQTKPGWWGAIVETFNKFGDDDVMTQAAALAFYTGISLAPLLTMIVWVMTIVAPASAKEDVIKYAKNVVGAQAELPVRQLIAPETVPTPQEIVQQAATRPGAASLPTSGTVTQEKAAAAKSSWTIAGLGSIAFLSFTASGVLAQLQSSLNLIWNVKPDPKRNSIILLIRKRVFSFGMLFTVLFLLLVSVAITFTIGVALRAVSGGRAEEITAIAQVVNIVLAFGVATGVFMLLFTYLPDVRVPWRDTLFGAALTAALFVLGRYVIGLVLARSDYSTSYGATIGSFLAVLVWVYYTSIIMFLGTEATTVFTRRRGHDPVPEKHAVRMLRTERAIEPPSRLSRLASA